MGGHAEFQALGPHLRPLFHGMYEALQVGLDAGLNPESPLFAAIQKKLD